MTRRGRSLARAFEFRWHVLVVEPRLRQVDLVEDCAVDFDNRGLLLALPRPQTTQAVRVALGVAEVQHAP